MAQQVTFDLVIGPQLITNAAASYYTVGANQKIKILKATAANVNASAQTLQCWIGAAASDAYKIVPLATIPPTSRGLTLDELIGHVCNAAEQIFFQASANSAITIRISAAILT